MLQHLLQRLLQLLLQMWRGRYCLGLVGVYTEDNF
jgi:hypothetical protein